MSSIVFFKYNCISSLSTHVYPPMKACPGRSRARWESRWGGNNCCGQSSHGHSRDMWCVDPFAGELPGNPGLTELPRLPLLSLPLAQSSMHALTKAPGPSVEPVFMAHQWQLACHPIIISSAAWDFYKVIFLQEYFSQLSLFIALDVGVGICSQVLWIIDNQNNLLELVLSFYCTGPRVRIQLVRVVVSILTDDPSCQQKPLKHYFGGVFHCGVNSLLTMCVLGIIFKVFI